MNNKSIIWKEEAVAAIAASFSPHAERAKEVIMDAQLAVMALPEAVVSKEEPKLFQGMKACPFCGAFPWIGGSEDVNGKPYYYVTCPKCFASLKGSKTEEEAIEAWNRRVSDD